MTTVAAGNCGFTLAPLNPDRPADADYTRRMMSKVEGMSLVALEEGAPWSWSSFGEYLDALEGRIAVNAGFMVGHCALRRYVMGAEAVGGQPSAEQLEAIVGLLHEAMEAGCLGVLDHAVVHAFRRGRAARRLAACGAGGAAGAVAGRR